MFTPRGSPCFVFLCRRVHHHRSRVFALGLRLFVRLACRPHDHGSRSTASVSLRAPWWVRHRGFRHGYGCSVGAQPLTFCQRCWGSPRGHDGGGSERYVALFARSWWIVVFFWGGGGGWDTRLPIESPFFRLRHPLSSTSVSPRGTDALPALVRCRRWRRGRPSACAAGRTPSLPSRHGHSAGCFVGRGDGGAVVLRAVSWVVLPPFPLGVNATAAREIFGMCRGSYSLCPSRGAGDGGAGSAAWAAGRTPPLPSLSRCG